MERITKKLGLIGRILLGAGSLLAAENANGDILDITCRNSEFGSPKVGIRHQAGALEGYDSGHDSSWQESPAYPRANFYSRNTHGGGYFLLRQDSRPPESMSTYNLEVEGVGLPEEGAEYRVTFWRDSTTNFPGKNIISVVYSNPADPNTIERVDDVKYLHSVTPSPTTAYTIQVFNGISKYMNVMFFNHADLNLDGRVNMGDLAILSKNWCREGIAEYSPSIPDNYADINRDGNVGLDDLVLFASEWL